MAPQPPVDMADRGPNILAAFIIEWVGAFAAIALRFVARRKSKAELWWDDYLIIFTMVPFCVNCALAIWGVTLGAGKHTERVLSEHPENLELFLKFIYAVEITYPWIIGSIKCSILCLYLRIFGVNRKFRFYVYALIAATVGWAISLEFGSIFQCTPVSDAWNPRADRSTCVDLESFLVGTNSPNILLDFLILTAPLVSIWKLNLSMKRKVFVSLIMMLGAGEVVFSIVRLIVLLRLDTSDAMWNYFDAIIWSTVEMCVGIVCVCLPTYAPLLPAWMVGRRNKPGAGYATKPQSSNSSRAVPSYLLHKVDPSHAAYTPMDNNSRDFHREEAPQILRTTDVRVESDRRMY